MNEAMQLLVSDEQIDNVWGSANFGSTSRREIIRNTLLKCACGYSTGHTAACIVHELGLVNKITWTLTKLGQQYLFEAYSDGVSI